MSDAVDDFSPELDAPQIKLGSAVRHLSRLIVTKELAGEVSLSLASKVSAIVDELERQPDRASSVELEPEQLRRSAGLFNTVIGRASPQSAPMQLNIAEDGTVTLTGALDRRSEGPPGCAHGGVVATLLDQALGHANSALGIGAFTAEITTRFLKPTPLDVQLTVRARADEPVGRKIVGHAMLEAEGEITATAEGTFVAWDRP